MYFAAGIPIRSAMTLVAHRLADAAASPASIKKESVIRAGIIGDLDSFFSYVGGRR